MVFAYSILLLFYNYFYNFINIFIKFLDWVNYYSQSYVLASLNLNASNIDPEVWAKSSNNTNVAEAAHALANKEGKQLKLLTAIIKLVFLMKINSIVFNY